MGSDADDAESKPGCWKKKSPLEKKVIITVTIIALVLAASVIIILTGIFWIPSFLSSSSFSVCRSPTCTAAASRIKSYMNESASPCDDFYEYACGGWMKNSKIPDDRGSWGAFDTLREDLTKDCIPLLQQRVTYNEIDDTHFPKDAVENARAFYQACVDVHVPMKEAALVNGEIAALKALLYNIGCRVLNSSSTLYKPWYKLISNSKKNLGMNFLMNFDVEIDDKSPEDYIISLDQPNSFGLHRIKLLDLEKNKKFVDAYKTYIRSIMCFLNGKEPCPSHYQELLIQKIVDFESKIAKLTKEPALRRDPHAQYTKMSIYKLQSSFNASRLPWSWKGFLNEILSDAGIKVNASTEILVKEEGFLKNLTEVLLKEDPKIVAEYVCARVVQKIGPHSSNKLREMDFEFQKVVSGIQKLPEVEKQCFTETNKYYGFAVGSLYVKKKFNKAAKLDMLDMEKKISTAFSKLVEENTWMDEETKQQSALKLSQMVAMIGYPEWIMNQKELNKYYEYLQDIVGGNFTDYLVEVKHAKNIDDMRKLNVKANRTFDWNSAPSVVNAFYSASANSITFPAGILQPPFYQHNTLHSLNYGSIGYVIGHEVTHGYDDQGCEYNGAGKLESWWTRETKDRYNHRKKCFIDQYSQKYVILDNEKVYVKGNSTIGENIADNGGIREAYTAYLSTNEGDKRLPGLEHLNNKKLFFLSAAGVFCNKYRPETLRNRINNDEHSPGMFRVTIPLANMEEFGQVFGCKKGTTMNPQKKCVLW